MVLGDDVASMVRNVFVDRTIREQTDKVQSTCDLDAINKIDPCVHVYPNGIELCQIDQVTLGTSLFDDVGVHDDLFGKLDHTSTQGGRACLKALVNHPISDLQVLRDRQDILRQVRDLVVNKDDVIRQALAIMKETESDVAWALQHPKQDDEIRELYSMAFFKLWPLRCLNESPIALTLLNLHRIVVSPLVGLLSPLVYFVIPYLVLRYRVGLKCSFFQYLKLLRASMSVTSSITSPSVQWAKYASLGFSLLFYFQSVFSSIELSKTLSSVCSTICKRCERIDAFNDSASKLVTHFSTLGLSIGKTFFPQTRDFGMMKRHSEMFYKVSDKHLLLHNFGKGLSKFHVIDRIATCELMRDAYAIDALISINDARVAMRCCDTVFTSHKLLNDRPRYDAKDLRHPCMSQASCVSNSIHMTEDVGSSCAALLTGPNAGGKSTLLKSILLSSIMAQTLTIAPCVSLTMSPYSHIHSHINVPDVQGSKSLYEAEMERAKESMTVLAEMSRSNPNCFSLLVMDEVFSSTNPIEGIAGAYSVAKNLASSCNATLIVSTHFLYLRKLATLKRENGSDMFQLVQMPVKIDGLNTDTLTISYPYKLHSGVCEQLIALELLKASGFPKDVVDDALEIKQILLSAPVRKKSRSSLKIRDSEMKRKMLRSNPIN